VCFLAECNVRIFTADIIYHLFDQFTAYMKEIKAQEQEAARLEAVFPCTLQVRLVALLLNNNQVVCPFAVVISYCVMYGLC
jgi:translation initiation factor 5B